MSGHSRQAQARSELIKSGVIPVWMVFKAIGPDETPVERRAPPVKP